MTIDITIGEIQKRTFEEVFEEMLDDYYTYTYETRFQLIRFLFVTACPPEDDGCTEKDTMCPGSAYRSGATTAIHEFFREVMPELSKLLRPISSNDRQITRIKPYLEKINALEYKGENYYHQKRLHWLKFWCNKAVELYGDDAAIQFT